MGFKQLIVADAFRYRGRTGAGEVAHALAHVRTFRPIFTLRLCQALASKRGAWLPLRVLARVLHRMACHQAAMDLPWATKIGPGFCITHGWGLVVNQHALFGANVTLFHGATIGRSDSIQADGERISGYPVIEDNAWIGPHAIVVGGVTVGAGSRVAGGALVFKSVEPACIVSGNPAQVVRRDCPPDVMNPVDLRQFGVGVERP